MLFGCKGVGRGFTWHIAWTEFADPGCQRFRLTCSGGFGQCTKSQKNRSGLENIC